MESAVLAALGMLTLAKQIGTSVLILKKHYRKLTATMAAWKLM